MKLVLFRALLRVEHLLWRIAYHFCEKRIAAHPCRPSGWLEELALKAAVKLRNRRNRVDPRSRILSALPDSEIERMHGMPEEERFRYMDRLFRDAGL